MTSDRFLIRPACASVAAAAAMALVTFAVQAQPSPAAWACPDFSFLSGNLAINPGFEVAAPAVPDLVRTCWQRAGDPFTSAAAGWLMHTDNWGAPICSRLVPSDAPGPRGERMLYIEAGGVEGGIYQSHALDPTKRYMFSISVKVLAGKVVIASRAMVGGPVAWSSKIGEWEQLRVCTNSLANTDSLVVYNWAQGGGRFFVDRAELREMP